MPSSIIVTLTGDQVDPPAGVLFANYEIVLTDAAGVVQKHNIDGTLVSFSQFDNVADGSTSTVVITAKDTSGNPLPAPFVPFTVPPFVTPIPKTGSKILQVTGATVTAA
jgi:hypothetical protein